MPDASVVIAANRLSREHVEKSVLSILRQSLRPRQLIIVLEDDVDVESLCSHVQANGVECVSIVRDRLDRNRSWNLGISAAKYPLVALVKPGAVLGESCLQRLAETLLKFRTKGVVGVTARVRVGRRIPRQTRLRRRLQIIFGIRQLEMIGCMGQSGFTTPVDELDHLGVEPFDVHTPSRGATLFQREALLEHPFPEGYSYLAGDGEVFAGIRITRHHRILFDPYARVKVEKAPREESPFQRTRKKVLNGYWTYHCFARRRPTQFARFAYAAFGQIVIPIFFFILHPEKRLLAEASGALTGFAAALKAATLNTSITQAMEKAALNQAQSLHNAQGQPDLMRVDPLEPKKKMCKAGSRL